MPRVLVIDDDARLREGIVRFLTISGYDVEGAEDGSRALDAFETNPADVVVTDINMPGMDGIEVILKLKELCPSLPVVAMSGGGLLSKDLLLNDADLLGAIESVPKPFKLSELLTAVERALRAA